MKKTYKKETVKLLQKQNIEGNQVPRESSEELILKSDYNDIRNKEKIEELDFKKQINELIIINSIISISLIITLIIFYLYYKTENNLKFVPISNAFVIAGLMAFCAFIIILTIINLIKIINLFKLKEVENPKIISIIKDNCFNILSEKDIQVSIFKKAIKEYFIKTGERSLFIKIKDNQSIIYFRLYQLTDILNDSVVIENKGLSNSIRCQNINLALKELISFNIDNLIDELYKRSDGFIDIKKEDLYLK